MSGPKKMRAPRFTSWLRQRMAMREWRQADLARALDVLPGTVQRWASGTVPSPENIALLADLFAFDQKTLMIYAGYIDPDDDDPDLRELMAIWSGLPEQERTIVIEFARFRRDQVRRAKA